MRRCERLEAADWLVTARTPWQQLVTFGPSGFDAYARVRYLPDPEFVGQREGDVQLPEDRLSNLDVARRALRYLANFTNTVQRCYFCLWDGYLGAEFLRATADRGPLVTIAHRSYALFAAPLNEIDGWEQWFPDAAAAAPAFVWPEDRRWCLASDVDPHWAGIGAASAAVDSLVEAPDLDAVRADPELQVRAYA